MQQEGTSLPDGFILLPTPVTPSCESLQCCSSEWSFVQAGICESSSLPHPFLHYFRHPPESCWIWPTFHWCIMRWEDSPLPRKENPFYFCKNVNRKTEFSYKQKWHLFPSESVSINANCINSFCKENRIAQWVKPKQYDVHEASIHLYIWCFTQLMLQVFLAFSFFALLFISALSVTAGLSQFILPEEVGQNCISTWDETFPKTCIVSILFFPLLLLQKHSKTAHITATSH